MLHLLLFLCCCFGLSKTEAQSDTCRHWDEIRPPTCEFDCMKQFNDTASGVHAVNAYLLAKMTGLMYLDHLEYQLQYLQNDAQPLDFIPSSDWIKANNPVDDSNFEDAFSARFKHYFMPASVADQQKLNTENYVQFKYLQKSHTGHYRFMGIKYQSSLDPELMIISSPTTVFILFRGTDDVGQSAWAEWIGTDLKINQVNAGGALVGTKLHTGFWQSFDLVRDELIATLKQFKASQKKIWLAGHSLGAALAIISGTYLKSSGFDVQNIYAYGCPRTIGNRSFVQKVAQLLPQRVHRFEYYQDPITLLWAPGFKYQFIGQRNWYDEAQLGGYKMYQNIQERVVVPGSVKRYKHIAGLSQKEAKRIKAKQLNGLTPVGIQKLHYHSPQWYIKAAYQQLSTIQKKYLPKVDDSYPYLYYYRNDAK